MFLGKALSGLGGKLGGMLSKAATGAAKYAAGQTKPQKFVHGLKDKYRKDALDFVMNREKKKKKAA